MKYLLTGIILLFLYFVYSACVISGRCSKEEELEELKNKIEKSI